MVVGVVIAVLGAAVRFGGLLELLAGYDPEKVADHVGLQRFAGTGVLAIGALITVAGLADVVGSGQAVIVAIWVAVVVALVAVGLGVQRFSTRTK